MTWLWWRQQRLYTAAALALFAVFGVIMFNTGTQMQAELIHGQCVGCNGYATRVIGGKGLAMLSQGVPALLGIVWGAQLFAREAETGTLNFAWVQGVTRTRWLTIKAGQAVAAAVVWGGAVAAVVTWWNGPLNAQGPGQQIQPHYFDMQGIVPVGYSVFAMALGIAAGALLRRTLPAALVTVAGFAGVRLLVEEYLRPHYLTPLTMHIAANADNPAISVPAGWGLASGTVLPTGRIVPVMPEFLVSTNAKAWTELVPAACSKLAPNGGNLFPALNCLQRAGFRQILDYQPLSRFWPFQFIETGIFAALAAVLLAVAYVAVRRRDA